MKSGKIIIALSALALSCAITPSIATMALPNGIPSAAFGSARTRTVNFGQGDIQRAYLGNNLVFVRTHDVVYHDIINGTDRTQTLEVENGSDAIPGAGGFNPAFTKYTQPSNVGNLEFIGWSDSPSSYNVIPSKTVTGNADLYAVYRQPVYVRCSRDNSIIGSGYNYYTNGQKLANASITLGDKSAAGWVMTGYRSDTANQTLSAQYAVGGTYQFETDTTLHCLWYQDITKTLNFNSNGGNGVGALSKTIRLCYNSGNGAFGYYDHAGSWISSASVSIKVHGDPGRANHTFLGWDTDGNGTADIAAGGTYTFGAANQPENYTFIGVWKQNCASGTYSYSFSGDSRQIWGVGITNMTVAAGSRIDMTLSTSGPSVLSALACVPSEYRGEIAAFSSSKGFSPGQVSINTYTINAENGRVYNDMCENPAGAWSDNRWSMSRTFYAGSAYNGLYVTVHNRGQGAGSGETTNWTVTVTITPP